MVYVMLGTGFEEVEAITPVDLLRRAGVDVITVGINGKTVYGGHGIGVVADITIEEIDLSQMDMIVLPGGLGGVASIRGCKMAMDAIQYAHQEKKYIGAICAAPTILAELGITNDKQAVCYPGCESDMGTANMQLNCACVTDGHVITGTSAGCAIPFALSLIRVLTDDAQADRIASQIVIR